MQIIKKLKLSLQSDSGVACRSMITHCEESPGNTEYHIS